jgi:RNA polymerase sigma-70 factor (ECF subfamily)
LETAPEDPASLRRRAFEEEALPYLSRIWAAARRLLGSGASADAEDLVQETFLRAYRTFDNFQRGTNARAWLLTILYSVHVNRRRRREPQAWADDALEERAARTAVGGNGPAPAATPPGERADAALRRLPEPFRAAVLAVDIDGLTYEEAAAALDCPVGTVRSRLARARRRLATELADRARELGQIGRGSR